jgi:two-component system nitrate/nitrite response regulator NarL
MAGVIRVLIADDEPIYRSGLRQMVTADPHCRVVGESGSARELVALIASCVPDVILLGNARPARALASIREHAPEAAIVLVTRRIETAAVTRARRLGARGLLLRTVSAAVLLQCLRAVADGRLWMGRGEPAALAWDDNTRLPGLVLTSGLTPRELEVVSVIVEGASNRDIAHLFSISENTVKHHLTRIFDKVGVSTRLELAVRAAASR